MEKENNSDILQQFNIELCSYLTRISRTCTLIRKHKENLQTYGDFSFPVQLKYWLRYIQNAITCKDSSTNVPSIPNVAAANPMTVLEYSYLNRVPGHRSDTVFDGAEWALQNIIENSKSWPLVVSNCALQIGRVQLYLDRKFTFRCVLQSVLSQKSMYGQFPAKQQRFFIITDILQEDRNERDLSELRVDLLRSTTIKLLEATGYELADMEKSFKEEATVCLHFSTKSSEVVPGYQQVLCGVVINSRHHNKDNTITAQEYLRRRCREIKTMAMHKYGGLTEHEPQGEDFLNQLGDAAVRIDLLHVKPSHTVTLTLDAEVDGIREINNRGAVFILYNCARLAALLRQFEEKVQLGYYPQLIPYEEVDFLLLSKEEEWDLVFSYILSYPSMLQSSVQNVEHGKLAPHLVCSFIMEMCSCFSVYYRRVRILTQLLAVLRLEYERCFQQWKSPWNKSIQAGRASFDENQAMMEESRSHLLPVMFARLYLLQGIQQVLHNALNLLGIKPVMHM